MIEKRLYSACYFESKNHFTSSHGVSVDVIAVNICFAPVISPLHFKFFTNEILTTPIFNDFKGV